MRDREATNKIVGGSSLVKSGKPRFSCTLRDRRRSIVCKLGVRLWRRDRTNESSNLNIAVVGDWGWTGIVISVAWAEWPAVLRIRRQEEKFQIARVEWKPKLGRPVHNAQKRFDDGAAQPCGKEREGKADAESEVKPKATKSVLRSGKPTEEERRKFRCHQLRGQHGSAKRGG